MQKISPFLWFDGNAEDAANFYTSVFPGARLLGKSYYGEHAPAPAGTLMTASLELQGQHFVLLNGGPQFQFTPAISFVISCDTQAEIDHYWEKLAEGGTHQACGWLQDKFGISWQVVPAILPQLMTAADKAAAGRVMQALLEMSKIDVATLQRAAQHE